MCYPIGVFLICPSLLQKSLDILKDLAKFKTASHVDRHKLKVVFKQTKKQKPADNSAFVL